MRPKKKPEPAEKPRLSCVAQHILDHPESLLRDRGLILAVPVVGLRAGSFDELIDRLVFLKTGECTVGKLTNARRIGEHVFVDIELRASGAVFQRLLDLADFAAKSKIENELAL